MGLGLVWVFIFDTETVSLIDMDFKKIFPIVDFNEKYKFSHCFTAQEFLIQVVDIYFNDMDSRIREACLSVYMAYRDHYPSYLVYLDQERIERLNSDIQMSSGKIIKLRRIVLSQLSKVA